MGDSSEYCKLESMYRRRAQIVEIHVVECQSRAGEFKLNFHFFHFVLTCQVFFKVGKLYRLFINDVIKFNKDAVETLLWLLIVAPKVPEVTPRTLATSQK